MRDIRKYRDVRKDRMTNDHYTWAPTMPNRTEHFWDQVGTTLHRSGQVTDDHAAERARQIKAVDAILFMGEADWDTLQMLFAPMNDNVVGKGGTRRVIHRAEVAHPLLDSVVGGQG